MKTYGQETTDLLVFARDLTVDGDCLGYVTMSTAASSVAFLTPKDVASLIEQLQTWLDHYHTGGVE